MSSEINGNTALLINHAKENGKEFLANYTLGVIKGITSLDHNDSDVKVAEILETIMAFEKIDRDTSISWKTKKPSAPTEDQKGNYQPQCTIDTSKVEPLVDRVWAESLLDNLRNEG